MSAAVDPNVGGGEDDEAQSSMLPGASQFFPGAAFLLILISMFTAFIVNRTMWATQFCPSGDDFFVLATGGEYMSSNNSCFTAGPKYSSGKCDAVIASGARVPTNLSTGQNRSEYLRTHDIDCTNSVENLPYPLFSYIGREGAPRAIFTIGMAITFILLELMTAENFLRLKVAVAAMDTYLAAAAASATIKPDAKALLSTHHKPRLSQALLKVALASGLVGPVCLLGLTAVTIDTKPYKLHLAFVILFFGLQMLYSITNTWAVHLQLLCRERQADYQEASNPGAQAAHTKNRTLIAKQRLSVRAKYATIASVLFFFVLCYPIGMPLTGNGGRGCSTWSEDLDPGRGVALPDNSSWTADYTIDCCGQRDGCESKYMLRSTTQSLTVISLIAYLATLWFDFRIEPSAEVEALVKKSLGFKSKFKSAAKAVLAANRMATITTGMKAAAKAENPEVVVVIVPGGGGGGRNNSADVVRGSSPVKSATMVKVEDAPRRDGDMIDISLESS